MPALDPQRALAYGPGRFRALFTFTAKDSSKALLGAATLLAELEMPELSQKPLKVLVALRLGLLAQHSCYQKLQAEHLGLYGDQADVLIQIAAETEDDRTYARRLVKRVLGAAVELREEYYGGRHMLNREAFGYKDMAPGPGAVPVSQAVADGGVSWLLYQRCAQDVAAFYENLPAEADQDAVVGHGRNHVGQGDMPTPNSHIAVSRQHSSSLLRRSFSQASYDEDNLLFIAAAAHPKVFEQALAAFKAQDPLGQHVALKDGGLFVVPPSSAWLAPGARLPALGSARPASEEPFYPSRPLVLYDMTPTTQEFFVQVFHHHKDGFDELGALREDIKLITRGFVKLVYGGRLPRSSLLYRLLDRAFVADASALARQKLATPEFKAALALLATKRIAFEGEKLAGQGKSSAGLAALEAKFEQETKAERALVRGFLTPLAKLSLGDDDLSRATIEQLYAEVMLEDAENMSSLDATSLQEINEIAILCEKAATEGRGLNDVAGKYMTLIC